MLNLDLSKIQSDKPQGLPDGKYTANITSATMKPTKAGNKMIVLEFTIADGAMASRKVWENLVIEHENPKVVEINLGRLKSILENSGYATPDKLESLEALSGLRVGIKTKTRIDEQYGNKTEISYYFKPEASREIPF